MSADLICNLISHVAPPGHIPVIVLLLVDLLVV